MSEKPTKVADGVYCLCETGSRCYLVLGSDRGLVIDTGFGDTDILAAAKSVTGLPLVLVNTHYHGDHTARNADFGEVYAHPLEHGKLKNPAYTLVSAPDGYKFELGGKTVSVIHTPGHTPGAVALLDEGARVLFTGDSVADVPVYMQGSDCDLEAYVKSLERILSMRDRFDTVLVCHGTSPVDIVYAEKLRKLALKAMAGDAEFREVSLPGGGNTVNVCTLDGAGMYRN